MIYPEYGEAREVLEDDALYKLLFNRLEDTELDEVIDEVILDVLEHKQYDIFIDILKRGGFYQTVEASLSSALNALLMKTGWYSLGVTVRRDVICELINRYYGVCFTYKNRPRHPLVRSVRSPKTKRKTKYTKKEKFTPTELLVSPI